MRDALDLGRYPLDKIGTPAWQDLVDRSKADLLRDGMFNLAGLVRDGSLVRAVAEVRPIMDTPSFVHRRSHNIYFMKNIPGLAEDHPALTRTETIIHAVCADQFHKA